MPNTESRQGLGNSFFIMELGNEGNRLSEQGKGICLEKQLTFPENYGILTKKNAAKGKFCAAFPIQRVRVW